MRNAQRFEALVLPHLDAGYNLARWLLRNEAAAEDATHDASVRALRYFDSFRGEAARPWFLGIVRNTCFDYLAKQRGLLEMGGFDDDALDSLQVTAHHSYPDPAEALSNLQLRQQLDDAIAALVPTLREVIVLREMENLDYAEIAKITAAPIGTVMSRLSRARSLLRERLRDPVARST